MRRSPSRTAAGMMTGQASDEEDPVCPSISRFGEAEEDAGMRGAGGGGGERDELEGSMGGVSSCPSR